MNNRPRHRPGGRAARNRSKRAAGGFPNFLRGDADASSSTSQRNSASPPGHASRGGRGKPCFGGEKVAPSPHCRFMPRRRNSIAMLRTVITTLTTTVALITFQAPAAEPASFPVAVQVQADRPRGELKPIWRFFGADEPNYAYMEDGKKLIG